MHSIRYSFRPFTSTWGRGATCCYWGGAWGHLLQGPLDNQIGWYNVVPWLNNLEHRNIAILVEQQNNISITSNEAVGIITSFLLAKYRATSCSLPWFFCQFPQCRFLCYHGNVWLQCIVNLKWLSVYQILSCIHLTLTLMRYWQLSN